MAPRPLRILLVLKAVVHFRHFDHVVRELDARGHTVRVVFASAKHKVKRNTTDRAVQDCLASCARLELATTALREDLRWGIAWRARELLNYSIYFEPGHTSPTLAQRWRVYLPRTVRSLLARTPRVERVLVGAVVRKLAETVQRALPADRAVADELRDWRPDVVVASPFIYDRSVEVEYINAARELGVPSIVHVLSWDNLTTKGTFAALADVITVWNTRLRDEAIALHRVPAERLIVIGAPTFDYLFAMAPSVTRAELASRVGLDPAQPIVTYLCSSTSIAQDEKSHVLEFVRSMKRHPATSGVGILVRPHPLNADIWKDFAPEGFVLWPSAGTWPDVAEAQQIYFDTLHHSAAVVGVNTSAFLEAAILDRPCITALTEIHRATQTGRGHFAHLLAAGFITTTASLDEAAAEVGAIVRGRDDLSALRRAFVHDFIRPRGLARRASDVLSDLVEQVADRVPSRAISATLASADVVTTTHERQS